MPWLPRKARASGATWKAWSGVHGGQLQDAQPVGIEPQLHSQLVRERLRRVLELQYVDRSQRLEIVEVGSLGCLRPLEGSLPFGEQRLDPTAAGRGLANVHVIRCPLERARADKSAGYRVDLDRECRLPPNVPRNRVGYDARSLTTESPSPSWIRLARTTTPAVSSARSGASKKYTCRMWASTGSSPRAVIVVFWWVSGTVSLSSTLSAPPISPSRRTRTTTAMRTRHRDQYLVPAQEAFDCRRLRSRRPAPDRGGHVGDPALQPAGGRRRPGEAMRSAERSGQARRPCAASRGGSTSGH
jgi:hypothetical protein